MIIGHKKDTHFMESLPKEVQDSILKLVSNLDNLYGDKRNVYVDDGGYALVLESQEDFKSLVEVDIDLEEEGFEYVERINCREGEDWANALVLLNNEFGVSIYMPESLASKRIISEME